MNHRSLLLRFYFLLLVSFSCVASIFNGQFHFRIKQNGSDRKPTTVRSCLLTNTSKEVCREVNVPDVYITEKIHFQNAHRLQFTVRIADKSFLGDTRRETCVHSFNESIKHFYNGQKISKSVWLPFNDNRICSFTKMIFQLQALVQCSKYHYGAFCNSRCVPNEKYSCTANGTRICANGWNSRDCETPIPCANHKCPDCETAVHVVDSNECSCLSVTDYKECMADPCSNITCLNGGACRRQAVSTSVENVTCSCIDGFYGSMCQLVSSTATVLSTTFPPTPESSNFFLVATIILAVVLSFSALLVAVLLHFCRCRRQIPSKPPSPEFIRLRSRPTASGVYEDPEVSPYTDFDSNPGSDFSISSGPKDEDNYHLPGAPYTVNEASVEPPLPPRLPQFPAAQPVLHFVRRS